MNTQQIPREPIEFDADGFEEYKRYNVYRKTETHRITFHNVLAKFFEDGGGYKHVRFDVSTALATLEPLDN